MGREKESRMAKCHSKAGTGQHMGRETRVWMPRNQSKAGMGIAYGQRNKSVDGEKSVPNRHKSNKMADKRQQDKGAIYMKQIIQQKIAELNKILKLIGTRLKESPEGSLKIQKRLGKTYYYHQLKENGKYVKHYIGKDDIKLARELANKSYYMKVKPLLEKELKMYETLEKIYDDEAVNSIYNSLSEERKCLVKPVMACPDEILRRWDEEIYEINQKYSENMVYKTDQGEMVRSKSELIIANILYKNREMLKYKYERQLELMIEGHTQTIYPDFTILNVRTGKLVYWEHAGRMDDTRYAANFVKKINTYIDNGIIPGMNLIVTYETVNSPIVIQHIQLQIEILKQNMMIFP